jgi:hypothetical protein
MLIILFSLLVLIIGALYYLLSGNPKRAQLGLVAFAVGLYWFVGQIASTHLHLFDGLR